MSNDSDEIRLLEEQLEYLKKKKVESQGIPYTKSTGEQDAPFNENIFLIILIISLLINTAVSWYLYAKPVTQKSTSQTILIVFGFMAFAFLLPIALLVATGAGGSANLVNITGYCLAITVASIPNFVVQIIEHRKLPSAENYDDSPTDSPTEQPTDGPTDATDSPTDARSSNRLIVAIVNTILLLISLSAFYIWRSKSQTSLTSS